MSPPTQLHADARDVDDSHLVSIALASHEDSTCRAVVVVSGQGNTDCTKQLVPPMPMTACCRYLQLPLNTVGSSHHTTTMPINRRREAPEDFTQTFPLP